MNNKIAINTYQQLNLKNKLNKQVEKKQNHRYGDYSKGYQLGGGRGEMGKRCRV